MESQSNGVYDKEDQTPVTRPNLQAMESGSNTTKPTSSSPKSLEDKEKLTGGAAGGLVSGTSLKSETTNPAAASSIVGGASMMGKKMFGVVKKNRKNIAIGGGAAGGLAALVVSMFLMLIPLKIEHIINNLEKHFYASGNQALQKETDNLLKRYIIDQVIPGYQGHCGSTIDKNCTAKVNTKNGPVSKLFNTWKDNKLENKLATKYGVEFKISGGGELQLKTPGNSIRDLGPEGIYFDSIFVGSDNAGVRKAVRDATANETRFKKVYTRFQVGRLLEKKYGVRRCLFFCKISDPLFKNISDQKVAAKLFLVNRIITPRSSIMGGAVTCLIDPACDPSKPEPTTPDDTGNPSNTDGENGRASSKLEKDNTKVLDSLLSKLGFTSIEDLSKELERINSEGGFTKDLVKRIVTELAGKGAGQAAGKAVPLVGQINLVAEIVQFAAHAGPKVRALGYIINSASAVATWGMYSSLASEIHTGHVTAAEVGSFTSALGPASKSQVDDTTNSLIGGTAGAEQSPLYSNLLGGSPAPKTATVSPTIADALLSPKIFAASTSTTDETSQYMCNDGKPVPSGQLVCNEENFAAGNGIANAISEWFKTGAGAAIKTIADIWTNSIGAVISGAQDIVGFFANKLTGVADTACSLPTAAQFAFGPILPLYCQTKGLISKAINPIVEAVVNYLIPQTVGLNMSGGRTFNSIAAGADVAGNDNAHSTLGGQALTTQQTAKIMNDEYNQELSDFNQQPFMAKIFNTDSRFSLVSSVAMSIPFNSFGATVQDTISSFISNPFNKLSSSFSSIINPRKAFAAPSFQGDPFGITQYGYPDGSIPDDPQQYWDDNCSDNAAQAYRKDNSWNDAAISSIDPNTQQGVNNTVNACLLIKSTAGAAGAVYDTSLLTDSQQQDLGGGN